ncbi:DUF1217 domain-containing protein [Jannaschia sp. W003]|uniref:DUF1217 domain-containing protein n=1 Tax=Jannaschia sp. W003 TaxID=2867012 RepID=UPI0021A29860|nr:DUF1217 domain-containing protein [Jannaschia sp. W003]UWQ21839.1 DUF1217 domain-containing protein [Jannaschia sp. W003]
MFQPVLPTGGLAGWRFLQRTLDVQQAAHAATGTNQRALDDFRARIGGIDSAEALVADRRLLSVALEAFGLSEDIDSRFFLRKVLEGGTTDTASLANRLADSRYHDLAEAFGFDLPFGPRTKFPGFADDIAARFATLGFESAVGEQDESLRLALNARRAFADVAEGSSTDDVAWFTVMGTPALRTVVEGALGLPKGVAALDLDRQLTEFRARAQQSFGVSTVAELTEPETLGKVIDRFLLLDAAANAPPTSPALVMLRGY